MSFTGGSVAKLEEVTRSLKDERSRSKQLEQQLEALTDEFAIVYLSSFDVLGTKNPKPAMILLPKRPTHSRRRLRRSVNVSRLKWRSSRPDMRQTLTNCDARWVCLCIMHTIMVQIRKDKQQFESTLTAELSKREEELNTTWQEKVDKASSNTGSSACLCTSFDLSFRAALEDQICRARGRAAHCPVPARRVSAWYCVVTVACH